MTRRGAMRFAMGGSLCAMLAACGGLPGGGIVNRVDSPAIRPDANGIAISGEAQRVDFGRTQASTVDAVTRLLDVPPGATTQSPDCGAGPAVVVKYPQIDLIFLDGTFRGWVTQNPGTVVGNGLSPGVSRAQLDNGGYGPFEESSLGVEFASDGISGLLPAADPNTQVQALWSGANCFVR